MAVNFVIFSNWTCQSCRKKRKPSKALIKATVFPLCLQKTDMKISPLVRCSLFHTILIWPTNISNFSNSLLLMENLWNPAYKIELLNFYHQHSKKIRWNFMASGSCQKICKLTVHWLLAKCLLPHSQLTDG